MKHLPEETYVTPGQDLNMSVTFYSGISGEDDVTLFLGHSFRGVYQDLTEHLVYEISEEDEADEGEGSLWELDLILPYPYSQASGDLTLHVRDNQNGDVTTTRLIIVQDGKGTPPFFDPVPKSVQTYPGQDVLINTQTKGSTPIDVSFN